jgi:hypothetical protein
MSVELKLTARGQITLRQAVLAHLMVRPGDSIAVSLLPDGRVELKAASASHDIRQARGALRRSRQRVVSLREMQDAIERGHDL